MDDNSDPGGGSPLQDNELRTRTVLSGLPSEAEAEAEAEARRLNVERNVMWDGGHWMVDGGMARGCIMELNQSRRGTSCHAGQGL